MNREVRTHLPVGFDDLLNELRLHHIALKLAGRAGSGGDQPLDVEGARVRHQPNH
jgi:hypothetical protein